MRRKVWRETSTPPVIGKENVLRRQFRPTFPLGLRHAQDGGVGFFCVREVLVAIPESNHMRAVVITVSDKGHAGEREDVSGPVLVQELTALGIEVVGHEIVPDEPEQIAVTLIEWADHHEIDLILTTGGTGLTPRDRTPEATLRVVDRLVPGLAEALRFEGYKKTPLAVLSRGIAGMRHQCVIINLPGSPKAVREGMATLGPVLSHAVRMARGVDTEHRENHDDHRHDDRGH